MSHALSASWWDWAFGGGLSFVFLWVISVPGACEQAVGEAMVE